MTATGYMPKSTEVPPVAEAIRLMRQIVDNVPDVDARWTVGYAEGVAYTMAVCDPWCQDAEDVELWKQCLHMHGARPHGDARTTLRRKAAWFEYIRFAAEWTSTEVVA